MTLTSTISWRRVAPVAALLAIVALIAALAAPISGATAADHLDAPALTSPDNRPDLDLNDVYVFTGSAPDRTVLIQTVQPLANADSKFASIDEGAYEFRIDTTGHPLTNIAYMFAFSDDSSWVDVYRATKKPKSPTDGEYLGGGPLNTIIDLADDSQVFAGLRSDPFFFDLSGFLGTVEGVGDDALGNDPTDFFDGLNTLAIVLEVPDSRLNDGDAFGVWARTSRPNGNNWKQVDRVGRPAINTVFNSSGPIVQTDSKEKDRFNKKRPISDVGRFTGNVVNALLAFSSLDSEGAYSDDQAAALAAVLLPDLLVFDKASNLPAPLNGRQLADDVIDVELRIVTGGDPLGLFNDRDADGAINSDGVGPHDDYVDVFPYLGVPNV